MIQVPAMQQKGIHFDCNCINESDGALKNFLKQTEKNYGPLKIISVYGSMVLNNQLASCVPENTELVHINHGLKKFISKPRFDLIFFSLPKNGYEQSAVCETLCHCRMLLKPGGLLVFQTIDDRHDNLLQFFNWKKSMEARILIRAGYSRIHRLKMAKQRTFICGQRPTRNF